LQLTCSHSSHPIWAEFFRSLRFIVIDEMHVYRGVFGSHVANVIRRLKRITRFYGASPQFISSATIANPAELASPGGDPRHSSKKMLCTWLKSFYL
jgi:ATP-dependent helicase YprA (DUF1998 family)